MPLIDSYNNGTAAVTSGSATVSGTGVLWSNVIEGDHFQLGTANVMIDAVNGSFDQLTLKDGWPGPTLPAAETITSGTYDSSTGFVTLTMSEASAFVTGNFIRVFSLTGTGGNLGLLAGIFYPFVSGNTILYNAGAGAGSITITGGSVGANYRILRNSPARFAAWPVQQAARQMANFIDTGALFGVPFVFDTGTGDADPGPGKIRANNALLGAATVFYISKSSRAGGDVSAFLASLDASTNTVKGTLILGKQADGTQAIYDAGVVTDASGYIKLAVSNPPENASAFGAGDLINLQFSRAGDRVNIGGGAVSKVAGRDGEVVLAQADIGGLTTSDKPTFAGATYGTPSTGANTGYAGAPVVTPFTHNMGTFAPRATTNIAGEVWVAHYIGPTDVPIAIGLDTFGNSFGVFDFRHSNGDAGTPEALLAGQIIGVIGFMGMGATAQSAGAAQIRGLANTNWSDTDHGSRLSFLTTPNGSPAGVATKETLRITRQVNAFNLNPANIDDLPAPSGGTILRSIAPDSTNGIVTIESFGGYSGFMTRAAGGTGAVPSHITNGSVIGFFSMMSRDDSDFTNGIVQFRATATQDHLAGHWGARAGIFVTPNDTTTTIESLTFDNDGSIYTPSVSGGGKGLHTINVAQAYEAGARLATVTYADSKASLAGTNTFTDVNTFNRNATAIGSLPAPLTGTAGRFISVDGADGGVVLDSFGGNAASFTVRSALGTGAAPTKVTSGHITGVFSACGYYGADFSLARGQLRFNAREDYSATQQGTSASIWTTPIGGTATAETWQFATTGGLFCPGVSGGDKGIGSINASLLYQGGAAVATQAYANSLVVGLIDDRGNWDASGNAFPTTGGSGSAGAILKGDLWFISVAGNLKDHSEATYAVTLGDQIRALSDAPGQTGANWAIVEANVGYVPTNAAIVPSTAPSAGQILVGNAGNTAYAKVTVSGDATLASTGAVTIAAGAVSLAKMANLAANSIIGNNTGGAATPIALTTAQVKSLLAIASTDVSGLGTAATVNTGTSGATIPLLNETNTFSGVNTFSNTTASTTSTTGGAIFGGGVGIAGNVVTGGSINPLNGVVGHAGAGGASSNNFTIYWNGSASRLWIDAVDTGTINVTSDYRIKDDVRDATPALDEVRRWRPVSYVGKDIGIFKAFDVRRDSFIAHELAAWTPGAVLGEKDAVTDGGDIQPQSLDLVPMIARLTKAVQEIDANVERMRAA